MKNKKIELKYIILIGLFVITVFLGIFSLTKNSERELTKLEAVLKDVVVSVQKVVYFPFKLAISNIERYNELKDVYEENKTLKSELGKFDLQNEQNKELENEIEKLKEIADMKAVLSDYSYLNASIITRNPTLWFNEINIDKGSNSGIKTGMAVITTNGLVGETIKVANFTSAVRLITSTEIENKISIKIQSESGYKFGIVSSFNDKTNNLVITGIDGHEDIKLGDIITTSGLGGKYPSGILVAKVNRITTDEYGLAKIIEAKPTADINNIKYITILKRGAE